MIGVGGIENIVPLPNGAIFPMLPAHLKFARAQTSCKCEHTLHVY
jgi:hypothetical protein